MNGIIHTDGYFSGGDEDDNLTGTYADDQMYGAGGNDTLSGLGGNDLLDGQAGNDSLVGGAGNDRLYGHAGNDTLLGGAGNDTLDGGTGRDSLIGGSGDDVFIVDYNNGAGDRDEVVEQLDGGLDRVESTVSFVLAANVENLILKGTANINGTGNFLSNRIDGNDGNNHLVGGGGNDSMWGGPGIDSMEGGLGNDTYYVDDIADDTYEAPTNDLGPPGTDPHDAGSGSNIDTVISQVSFTLRANVENLLLEGDTDLDGIGNALDNLLAGNNGSNALSGRDGVDILDGGGGDDTLDGGSGIDTLGGGTGNDTYVVTAGDTILESAAQGIDAVQSAVAWTLASNLERLTLTGTGAVNATGNTRSNTLTGNGADNVLKGADGADTLFGLAGADRLLGGPGKDTLTGGAGADGFQFDAALGTSNVDQLTDFLSGKDRIRLDDDVFTQFDASVASALAAGAFLAEAGSSAHDANDRIIYNTGTGALFYDPDGTGAQPALKFAVLVGAPTLIATDFIVVN